MWRLQRELQRQQQLQLEVVPLLLLLELPAAEDYSATQGLEQEGLLLQALAAVAKPLPPWLAPLPLRLTVDSKGLTLPGDYASSGPRATFDRDFVVWAGSVAEGAHAVVEASVGPLVGEGA